MEPPCGLQKIETLSNVNENHNKIKQALYDKRATNTNASANAATEVKFTNTATLSHTTAPTTLSKSSSLSRTNPPDITRPRINMISENYFDLLSSEDEEENPSEFSTQTRKRKSQTVKTQPKKSKYETKNANAPKPPPITIPSMNRPNAASFISTLPESKEFEIRFSADGIKIFAPSTEAFKAAKSKLIGSKTKFFTHLLRDEQTSKFILHGFYATELNELHSFLREAGVNPISIKNISIRNKRYDDHAVYLVHFLKSDKMKLSTLQANVKVINHVRVRWEFYQNKRNGPIQCTNCMSYGHGGASCFLAPVCIRCGFEHKSSECPLASDTTNEKRPRIPDEKVRCGLCGQNHPANYSGCVKRVEFIERQRNFRARAQANNRYSHHPMQNHANRSFAPAPELNNAHFPSIPAQNASTSTAWQQQPQKNHNNNPDLFTTGELINIMRDMMGRLRECTTKEQQFFVISEMAIEHVYGK